MSAAGYRIQLADASAVPFLSAIEVAAAGLFSSKDLPAHLRGEGIPIDTLRQAADDGRLWIAVRADSQLPVGFALAVLTGGGAHLEEVDVHPDHGRRGLGRALVEAVVDWARELGCFGLTLTTFRHVPWNAPFYRRLGFQELSDDALPPELERYLEEEKEQGLDRSRRVAMRLLLS